MKVAFSLINSQNLKPFADVHANSSHSWLAEVMFEKCINLTRSVWGVPCVYGWGRGEVSGLASDPDGGGGVIAILTLASEILRHKLARTDGDGGGESEWEC